MELHDRERERKLVRTVAKRWDEVYGPHFDFPIADERGSRAISEALHALDLEKATAQDVAAVIGNGTWVEVPKCHECDRETTDAAAFGDDEDDSYRSMTWVCSDCMRKALRKLAGRRRSAP